MSLQVVTAIEVVESQMEGMIKGGVPLLDIVVGISNAFNHNEDITDEMTEEDAHRFNGLLDDMVELVKKY